MTFLLPAVTAAGQEVLRASISRANWKNLPELGLPIRNDGEIDNVVLFRDGRWKGADSPTSTPIWNMFAMNPESPAVPECLGPVLEFCRLWAIEKPKAPAHIVYGPFKAGWFVAVCKKTRSDLGWKSLAFMIPPEGIDRFKSIYSYSDSVNILEYFIGYNLFPKLPSHIQEIIEEITAAELLCPFQESEMEAEEEMEREIEYEWEMDYREVGR